MQIYLQGQASVRNKFFQRHRRRCSVAEALEHRRQAYGDRWV